ncbi:class II histocompatibility antigen, M alpha chain isoform X1 [Anolis carolinensis]|uniref:class II histocompatibility antigen, M alpha chain isoform X1 n=1 Tax=Anolis carolinensis TaxID=28377 RepID=UPI002F2B27F1
MGLRLWPLGFGGLLCLWTAAGSTAQELPAHLFSEVFFCQPGDPSLGLAQALDQEPLFRFNFSTQQWRSILPELQPEEGNRTSLDQVQLLGVICQDILQFLTNISEAYMPEAKGAPQIDVFTLRPLEMGKPNTLVCAASNVFPPTISLHWELDGQPVSSRVSTPSQVSPVQGWVFQAFSYLEITPQEGQVYSCTARSPSDPFSSVAFWVPKDPLDPELLANVLCGLAFGLGILSSIAGAVFTFMALRLRNAE